MREYEISGRAMILGGIATLFILSLAAVALVAGLEQHRKVQTRTEATQPDLRLQNDMDAARAEIAEEQNAMLRAGQKAFARYQVEKD